MSSAVYDELRPGDDRLTEVTQETPSNTVLQGRMRGRRPGGWPELARVKLGGLRLCVDLRVSRHSGRDEAEPGEARAGALSERHRRAVERPVELRGRPEVDRIRRIEGSLGIGADELDAVTARDLALRRASGAVAPHDEAEHPLRGIPAVDGAGAATDGLAHAGV